MELRHLRLFAAVADHGGFVRAAAQLGISQPALSRQIRGLEAELGVRLFHRQSRRVHLTSQGADLLQRTRVVLTDAYELAARARSLARGETGLLRIGSSPLMLARVLASFTVDYRRRHPHVDVQFAEETGPKLAARLQRGDLDLALMPARADDRFHRRILFPGCTVVVVPTSHRLAKRRTVDVSELAKETIVISPREFGVREWFDAACRRARLRPRVSVETTSTEAILALVRTGRGIAVSPASAVLGLRDAHAATLTQGGRVVAPWIAIAWHPERPLPTYGRQFVDELVTWTRRRRPSGEFLRRASLVPRPADRADRA